MDKYDYASTLRSFAYKVESGKLIVDSIKTEGHAGSIITIRLLEVQGSLKDRVKR